MMAVAFPRMPSISDISAVQKVTMPNKLLPLYANRRTILSANSISLSRSPTTDSVAGSM